MLGVWEKRPGVVAILNQVRHGQPATPAWRSRTQLLNLELLSPAATARGPAAVFSRTNRRVHAVAPLSPEAHRWSLLFPALTSADRFPYPETPTSTLAKYFVG